MTKGNVVRTKGGKVLLTIHFANAEFMETENSDLRLSSMNRNLFRCLLISLLLQRGKKKILTILWISSRPSGSTIRSSIERGSLPLFFFSSFSASI